MDMQFGMDNHPIDHGMHHLGIGMVWIMDKKLAENTM